MDDDDESTTAASASTTGASREDDLAIPSYDSLAASQVVPRLDGLTSIELEAVRRYELAHRGRQHRARQDRPSSSRSVTGP